MSSSCCCFILCATFQAQNGRICDWNIVNVDNETPASAIGRLPCSCQPWLSGDVDDVDSLTLLHSRDTHEIMRQRCMQMRAHSAAASARAPKSRERLALTPTGLGWAEWVRQILLPCDATEVWLVCHRNAAVPGCTSHHTIVCMNNDARATVGEPISPKTYSTLYTYNNGLDYFVLYYFVI